MDPGILICNRFGQKIIIDRCTLPLVRKYGFTVYRKKNGYPIVRLSVGEKGRKYLCREIMNAKRGQPIHHENENTLDNRKQNLATRTHLSHLRLHGPRESGRFKGVHKRKRKYSMKYQATIDQNQGNNRLERKQIYCKPRKTPIEAALDYDNLVRSMPYDAYQNFPVKVTNHQAWIKILRTKGRVFTVYFRKRTNGEISKLTGRLTVDKGKITNGRYVPRKKNLIPIINIATSECRLLPKEGTIALIINKERFYV